MMKITQSAAIDYQPVPTDSFLVWHEARKKVVDIPTDRSTMVGVPRIVFHTLWRTSSERGTQVKVAKTEEVIIVSRLREAIPNPFLEVDPKSKKVVITTFNDGATRRMTLDDGESLTGTIDRLRVAAKTLDPKKGVRVALDGDKKTARSFRFELIPYTQRKKSDTTDAA